MITAKEAISLKIHNIEMIDLLDETFVYMCVNCLRAYVDIEKNVPCKPHESVLQLKEISNLKGRALSDNAREHFLGHYHLRKTRGAS